MCISAISINTHVFLSHSSYIPVFRAQSTALQEIFAFYWLLNGVKKVKLCSEAESKSLQVACFLMSIFGVIFNF